MYMYFSKMRKLSRCKLLNIILYDDIIVLIMRREKKNLIDFQD